MESSLGHYYELRRSGVCFTAPGPVKEAVMDSERLAGNVHHEVRFFIEGVHCSACLWLLESLPRVLPESVRACSLNLSNSVLSVTLVRPESAGTVASTLSKWGYVPHLLRESDRVEDRIRDGNRKSLIELGIAGALTGNIMLMSIPLYAGVKGEFEGLFEWASFALAIPSLFYSGRSFFKNVLVGIQTRTFPIDGPILLALLVAFFYSAQALIRGTHQLYFDSLSALIFLLLSSRYYLARLRQNSRMSLGALEHLNVRCESVPGDRVYLTDGVIGFDGVVRKGEAWCDASRFTGESLPVHLIPGSMVHAGTRLVSAGPAFEVEVLRTGAETRLAGLLARIGEIQNRRTETELRSDVWAKRLLAVVSGVAVVAAIYFAVQGKVEEGMVRILALLIVTCPCALALATPLVFTLAMRRLLKKGLLVKDPTAIDRVPELDRVWFDKTGTLTEGVLGTDWDPASLESAEASILLGLVSRSRHPVARTLEAKLAGSGVVARDPEEFREIPGLGLEGRFGGVLWTLFRPERCSGEGTESVFCRGPEEVTRIVFSDQIRQESARVIRELDAQGYRSGILSGDHAGVVSFVARSLGILEFHPGLSPEQKGDQAAGAILVGDGMNDALALARAPVSIAVQGGMEAAVDSAQAYSLVPGVRTVPELIRTGLRVRRTLRMNFALSTAYNLVGAILSLSGWMNPLIAAILMPLSALTVFYSSLKRMGGSGS
jgi:Cu+-exporting ATPase